MDCLTLQQGYHKFRSILLKECNIDIDESASISSAAQKYLINNNHYQGCYELSATPRLFIEESIVGGRTHCRYQTPTIVEEPISILDATSLYSTAIVELGGFLKGKPITIPQHLIKTQSDPTNNTLKEFLDKQTGYFVQCTINRVPIKRAIPAISIKETTRQFSNEVTGKTIILDKTTLEDFVEFHQGDLTIHRGYYFNQGRTDATQTITHLATLRKKYQKESSPIQYCLKVMLSSIYGKNIIKPQDTQIRTFRLGRKWEQFRYSNYQHIKNYTINKNQVICYIHKATNQHFNMAHIGAEILSMSKRIINRLIYTGEAHEKDNERSKTTIHYTDTDSIAVNEAALPELIKQYEAKYNRPVMVDPASPHDLGRFHHDITVPNQDHTIPTRSIRTIYLGKKSYYAKIEATDTKGNKIYHDHFRLKGIPQTCVTYTAKSNKETIEALYERLANKETIVFDLLEGVNVTTKQPNRARFKNNKNMTVTSMQYINNESEFIRTISFNK